MEIDNTIINTSKEDSNEGQYSKKDLLRSLQKKDDLPALKQHLPSLFLRQSIPHLQN